MIEKDLKKSDILDLDIYDTFDLLARANASDMQILKGVFVEAKAGMFKLANEHKDKMFKTDNDGVLDQENFDKEFTYVVQCFAMALYLDKKIELCERRIYDLTPECFKK